VRQALRWVCDYWYIPLVVAAALAAWFWLRPRGRLAEGVVSRVQSELFAIRAAQKTREKILHHHRDAVIAEINAKYRTQIEGLDSRKRVKVQKLERDPVALAKYLERLTR
jgi:hypothetical protein